VRTTASAKSNNPILFRKLIKTIFRRPIALTLQPTDNRIPLFNFVGLACSDAQNLLPLRAIFVLRMLCFALLCPIPIDF
jgi:hypothetical protein